MATMRAAVFAALLVSNIGSARDARADDISLRSEDGALELTGTLLGYDGEFYRIDTEHGVLTVDGTRVSCDGASCPGPGPQVARFTLAGAGAMADRLLPVLIGAFAVSRATTTHEARNDAGDRLFKLERSGSAFAGAEITLRSSRESDALVDLVSDQADMVLALREVTPNERAIADDAGLGDFLGPYQVRVLARDAIVARVNAANDVAGLTLGELIDVFSGEIDTWSDLGGPEEAIALHMTDPGSGIGEVFVNEVLDAAGKPLSRAVVIHPTPASLAEALDADPHAIGITGYTETDAARVMPLTGACGFEVTADHRTIEAGDYPLTVPMFLFLPERRLPVVARDFLAFLRSVEAQDIVRRAGFVAQDLTLTPLERQGDRLANAIRAAGPDVTLADLQRLLPLFDGKERLSLTFRFLEGSTALDPASKANVIHLAAALEAGDFDGQHLSFAGFSDSDGSAAGNLTLSERRAETVRTAVIARVGGGGPDGVTINAAGFGEASPMACDDTPWGRQVNRRVEVWVGPARASGQPASE